MTTLINEHLDNQILKHNYRLNYLFKLNKTLSLEPKEQHQNIVNSYVESSHIPVYMFLADIKDVARRINYRRHQAITWAAVFMLGTIGSAILTTYSQLSHRLTLLGSLAVFTASACIAGSMIVLDKLFIKQSDVINLHNLVTHFEKAGVANDNDN